MLISFINTLLISILTWFPVSGQPVFKSKNQTLNQFLDANMVYPWYAKQNCIQGTIKVAFRLNKNGELFHVEVINGLGIDLDDEALRLIRLTNQKWIIPENYDENTEVIIPVRFSLKNYDCDRTSKQEVEKAIALYQTRQTLEDVVTSYYQNKNAGKANTKNEQEIIQLKADLGFDEELVAEKLAEAKKMLKQGDKDGACETLSFIKNIGFTDADELIVENCK